MYPARNLKLLETKKWINMGGIRRNNFEIQEQAIGFVKQRLAGLSFKEIAAQHNYSLRTVEAKMDDLKVQFDAKDFPNLIGILIENGMIAKDPAGMQKKMEDFKTVHAFRIELQESIKRLNDKISGMADVRTKLQECLHRVNDNITKMEES